MLILVSLMLAMESLGQERPVLPNNPRAEAVTVSATIVTGDGQSPRLVFTLTNRGDTEVEVFRHTLWRGNIILVLAEDRPGAILREVLFPDDLPAGTWILSPGDSVDDEVALDSRFPRIRSMRDQGTLVLFWSLRVQYADHTTGPRVGGFLTLK